MVDYFNNLSNINSFQAFVFWFFGVIGLLILKFLAWVMPKTAKIWIEIIKETLTKEVRKDLRELNDKLNKYKSEKHSQEGENLAMREAILNNDKEVLESIREAIKNEKK